MVRQVPRIPTSSSTNVSAQNGCTAGIVLAFPRWANNFVATWLALWPNRMESQNLLPRLNFREIFSQVSGLWSLPFSTQSAQSGLGLAMVLGRMLRAFCPRSFFACSTQRACHNHGSLVVFLHATLPLCPQLNAWDENLNWKQPLWQAGQHYRNAVIPCMRATKRAKCIIRWKDDSTQGQKWKTRNKGDEKQKPACRDVEGSRQQTRAKYLAGEGGMMDPLHAQTLPFSFCNVPLATQKSPSSCSIIPAAAKHWTKKCFQKEKKFRGWCIQNTCRLSAIVGKTKMSKLLHENGSQSTMCEDERRQTPLDQWCRKKPAPPWTTSEFLWSRKPQIWLLS